MKSKVGASTELGHVWSAVRQADTVTPGQPTSTPTTTSAPITPLSCENKLSDKKEFKSPSGGLYLIECGVDYAGGDLKGTTSKTFEDCIEECDKEPHCVDVSFVRILSRLRKT